jgi:hypothetical protein
MEVVVQKGVGDKDPDERIERQWKPTFDICPWKRAVVIWRTVDVSNHKKFVLSLF